MWTSVDVCIDSRVGHRVPRVDRHASQVGRRASRTGRRVTSQVGHRGAHAREGGDISFTTHARTRA
ncbi:hypothetical protein SMD44_05128 [Streptomyces alboflavus]|uniref:Uncharacterized protein n=1 Tax=Streptomyces alboflavus TaxID=67267 RepID=A0A1Z1WGU3_9ACTN|nr:hypothetical protein SMD44_05128 [Streptomyces alboflavus]